MVVGLKLGPRTPCPQTIHCWVPTHSQQGKGQEELQHPLLSEEGSGKDGGSWEGEGWWHSQQKSELWGLTPSNEAPPKWQWKHPEMSPWAHTCPTVILFGMNYDTNMNQSPRDLGSNSKFSVEAPPSGCQGAFFDNSFSESLTCCSTHHPKPLISLYSWPPLALLPDSTRKASSRGLSGLSAVASLQDSHEGWCQMGALPPVPESVILLDQSSPLGEKGIALTTRTGRNGILDKTTKGQNQGEEKILIKRKWKKNLAKSSSAIGEKVVYVQVMKEHPKRSFLSLINTCDPEWLTWASLSFRGSSCLYYTLALLAQGCCLF